MKFINCMCRLHRHDWKCERFCGYSLVICAGCVGMFESVGRIFKAAKSIRGRRPVRRKAWAI